MVVLEMLGPDGAWDDLGEIYPHVRPASISSDGVLGRQVYLIGWHEGEGPAVWRSKLGVDIEEGLMRLLTTAGLDLVADLTEGPYEMTWRKPNRRARIRFRLVT